MTEAEALDMAARAAGWEDWYEISREDLPATHQGIRAHAATIMELAELMTTCEEATTRMELMYLQHQKVVDENAALKAENERLREALGEICRDSNPDWTEKRVYPNEVLDDIHTIAVNAYYKVKL